MVPQGFKSAVLAPLTAQSSSTANANGLAVDRAHVGAASCAALQGLAPVVTLEDEIKQMHLDSALAAACQEGVLGVAAAEDQQYQEEAEVEQSRCMDSSMEQVGPEPQACSVVEVGLEEGHRNVGSLQGEPDMHTLPGACPEDMIPPQLAEALQQDDQDMLEELGLSPSAGA